MTEFHVLSDSIRPATRLAQSALPNAPVIPEPTPDPNGSRLFRLRLHLTVSLRLLADKLEPAHQPRPLLPSPERGTHQPCV